MLTTLALVLLLKSARAAAQPIPVLLRDINSGALDSNPQYGTELNGVLYFTAYSPEVGNELWRSDGTPAGTWLVADIFPGPDSSTPTAEYRFARLGKRLYFSAWSPESGVELWATDGTAAGTVMIADIHPGALGS